MDTATSKSTVAVVASMDSKFIKGSATVRFVVFVSGLEELEDISHISSECLAPAFSAARTEAIIASDTDHNFFDFALEATATTAILTCLTIILGSIVEGIAAATSYTILRKAAGHTG